MKKILTNAIFGALFALSGLPPFTSESLASIHDCETNPRLCLPPPSTSGHSHMSFSCNYTNSPDLSAVDFELIGNQLRKFSIREGSGTKIPKWFHDQIGATETRHLQMTIVPTSNAQALISSEDSKIFVYEGEVDLILSKNGSTLKTIQGSGRISTYRQTFIGALSKNDEFRVHVALRFGKPGNYIYPSVDGKIDWTQCEQL